MYFKAISAGYAVPRPDFDATIHSVFQSALNLRPTNGGNLLTLVTSNEADLPQGIRMDTPDAFSFEIFHPGEQATCRDNMLRFDSSSLTIELFGARCWKCDLPALQAEMTNLAVSKAWQCSWQTLNDRQKVLGADIIAEDLIRSDKIIKAGVSHKAGDAMHNLIKATQQYSSTTTSSVRSLIGLGTGLTPYGDDLLVGYLAGLWCTVQDQYDRMQFISSLGKEVVRLSLQTNDISRTYLFHASQGQISSRLADLAEAICHGENSSSIHTKVESALQVGHTSGMDAVTGLLIGLSAWVKPGTPLQLVS